MYSILKQSLFMAAKILLASALFTLLALSALSAAPVDQYGRLHAVRAEQSDITD